MTTDDKAGAAGGIRVKTPAGDGKMVEETIPLPPADIIAEVAGEAAEAAPAAPEPAEPAAPKEVEKLDFCEPEMVFKTVPLDFPFNWDGRRIDTVTVRKITGAELGDFSDLLTKPGADRTDWAGFMADVPAKVIRGMEAGDCLKVVEAAIGFLPQRFRTGLGSTSS